MDMVWLGYGSRLVHGCVLGYGSVYYEMLLKRETLHSLGDTTEANAANAKC